MIGTEKRNACEMCSRDSVPITDHHLIPRTFHSNKWYKKTFGVEEMKTRKMYVCRACHDKIHQVWTEKELGRTYNTKELILSNEEIQRFIPFIRKQK